MSELWRCQNCQQEWQEEQLKEARDVLRRNGVGDAFSDKECQECGALCFPIKGENSESEYNSGDVMDFIYQNLGIDCRNCYDMTFDSDNDSGEICLTMPDGSEWIVKAQKYDE